MNKFKKILCGAMVCLFASVCAVGMTGCNFSKKEEQSAQIELPLRNFANLKNPVELTINKMKERGFTSLAFGDEDFHGLLVYSCILKSVVEENATSYEIDGSTVQIEKLSDGHYLIMTDEEENEDFEMGYMVDEDKITFLLNTNSMSIEYDTFYNYFRLSGVSCDDGFIEVRMVNHTLYVNSLIKGARKCYYHVVVEFDNEFTRVVSLWQQYGEVGGEYTTTIKTSVPGRFVEGAQDVYTVE